MARKFVAASSHSMDATASPLAALPYSMAVWHKPDTVGATQTALSIGSSSAATYGALGILSTGVGFFEVSIAGSADDASGPAAPIARVGAWCHLGVVAISATSRQVFVNGQAGTLDAVSKVFPTADRSNIGCLTTSGTKASFANGAIGAPCMWEEALTAAEMLQLAKGVHPFTIRPHAIVGRWPLDVTAFEYDASGKGDTMVPSAVLQPILDPDLLPRPLPRRQQMVKRRAVLTTPRMLASIGVG